MSAINNNGDYIFYKSCVKDTDDHGSELKGTNLLDQTLESLDSLTISMVDKQKSEQMTLEEAQWKKVQKIITKIIDLSAQLETDEQKMADLRAELEVNVQEVTALAPSLATGGQNAVDLCAKFEIDAQKKREEIDKMMEKIKSRWLSVGELKENLTSLKEIEIPLFINRSQIPTTIANQKS